MPFPYGSDSAQAAVLSAISNILAQGIKAHQEDTTLSLDLKPIVQFCTYAIVNTPLNCAWQEWLEDNFPGSNPPDPSEKDKKTSSGINITNTAIKFILDQTVGAAFNTILFIMGIGLLQGKSWNQCVENVKTDSMDIYWAGAKLWPVVSLLSFTLIPVNRRVVFGCIVGVLWGIILSLKVSE